MKNIKIGFSVVSLIVLCICPAGCEDKFWNPSQVGRFKPVPAVNVILDSLGVADETPAAWETGEEPRPADAIAYDTDYVFGPGDNVIISIYELLQEGQMYANRLVITETGKLSIPDVGVVNAAGLTESQLEEEIKQILSPNILKEPSVTVTLEKSEGRTYSVLGNGVPRPGRYEIPRYDYRIADGLANAGGINQFNISYIYVSRQVTGEETPAEPPATPKESPFKPTIEKASIQTESPEDMMDVIAPMAKRKQRSDIVISSTEMGTSREFSDVARPETLNDQEDGLQTISEVSDEKTGDRLAAARSLPGTEGRIEWIFQEGRWIPVQVGILKTIEGPVKEDVEQAQPQHTGKTATGWNQIGGSGVQRRAIRIPADKLLGGDPRYNIVIKPGDNIHVPVDIIGEFCIMGNVNNQGFINITGRPMTLKMAIAAAGGLGPLAWPKKCEVVRRIGKKREEIVLVDLDKIASGEQPDFFIKPNDLINVGTHPSSRYRAVLRNAFRATYGFGFVYDRNFADLDYGTYGPFDWIF